MKSAVVCLFVSLVSLVAFSSSAEAANLTVCASGCQYTSLQAAINAALPGDNILLRAGQTFVGNYTLRAKSSTSTAYITIRSDAADSSLPAAGVRLIPDGKPGANVSRSLLARLVGQGGTWQSVPVIKTEPGAHHYRLQFLEVDGLANLGYETLIQLGQNNSGQTSNSAAPHNLILDRLYLHGHPLKGMKRGIALDSRSTDVLNSYISDIKSTSDAQAIAGFNGAGPFRIINNHLEAAAENIMFGGSDPRISNLVPSDIEIRRNYIYKPLSWQNPVMTAPSGVSATAGGGGSLSSGTHYFKVVAVMISGGSVVLSGPSAERAVSVSSGGSVTLSWSAVTGADRYRVYRGTSSNGQNVYVETANGQRSITFTGSGQSSGTPRATGHLWTTKNLIELKNAQRVTIDGNVFENSWRGFQAGYAFMFTPSNSGGNAPWSVVRDVTITNNTVLNVGGGVCISGFDDSDTSQQARNFRIANNIFDGVGGSLGEGRFLTLTGGPATVTVDHNTIVSTGTIVTVDGADVPGFVYTNNFTKHNTYGVHGAQSTVGTGTLTSYFPSYVFRGNVLAGGDAWRYPSGNFFPLLSAFLPSFVNASDGNFALVSTSPYNNAATDGTDVGVNMGALDSAQGGSTPPPPPPPPPDSGGSGGGALPTDWESADIGLVGVPGSASFSSGTYTVRGGGADIWGSSDAFGFAYQRLSGDATIVARVASISGSEPWTKVGVMIRDSSAANSAHAMMLVSVSRGLAFQRRRVAGGVSTHTSGGTGTAPRWVRLARQGNVITASVSNDGQTWTVVGSDTFTMNSEVLVGLAVGSHEAGTLATGTFDNVSITQATSLSSGWESGDVGAVGVDGSTTSSGGTFTVRGSGADVWGSADAFHFTWQMLSGDGQIVARVASVAGTEAWTKAGVMMRMTLDAGSAQAFMFVSASNGLAFQRRTVTGGTSAHTSGGSGTAPRWLRLVRQGQVITASVSTNGTTWTTVGSDTFSIAGPLYVGLAVTSHDNSRLATGTFDNVSGSW